MINLSSCYTVFLFFLFVYCCIILEHKIYLKLISLILRLRSIFVFVLKLRLFIFIDLRKAALELQLIQKAALFAYKDTGKVDSGDMTKNLSVLRTLHCFILLASVDSNEFVTECALMYCPRKTNKH